MDVLTRITFVMVDSVGAELLQKAAVKTVDSLLEQLTENIGINAYKCPVMLLSGKTTMIHFLLPDKTRLQERRDITDTMFCFQFVSIPDLLVRMQAAKFIPHTDISRDSNIPVSVLVCFGVNYLLVGQKKESK